MNLPGRKSRIDLRSFGEGEYMKAMEEMQMAEVISKVLYPEDKHYEGKMLRLKQHYFFTSATLQNALKSFKRQYGNNLDLLPDKVVFHINDTHPGLAIPEMMRLLIDQEGLSWEMAQRITHRCMAYTNHTVMAEALERWPVDMMKQTLPRIFMILEELNRRVCQQLFQSYRTSGSGSAIWPSSPTGRCTWPTYAWPCPSASTGSASSTENPHGHRIPGLLPAGQGQVLRHHQRHHPPAMAPGGQPRPHLLLKDAIGDGFEDAQQLERLRPLAEDGPSGTGSPR